MKRFLLFLMVAVFVVMSGGAVWADTPEIGDNWWSLDHWGDGTTDALPVKAYDFGDDNFFPNRTLMGQASLD
jgi:hypothetical protein